jgi:hypothetical protein
MKIRLINILLNRQFQFQFLATTYIFDQLIASKNKAIKSQYLCHHSKDALSLPPQQRCFIFATTAKMLYLCHHSKDALSLPPQQR